MGKRELVIVAVFIVLGALTYQFTAPPAVNGQGFSLSRLLQGVRNEVNPSSGQAVHRGELDAPAGLEQVRLDGIRRVTITGESRPDIAYELTVESNGPDEATAKGYAARTTLTTDDLGVGLALGVDYPPEGTQTASLVLRVPARLSIRIRGRSEATISNVAGLHLDEASGEITAKAISGNLTGSHRGGSLEITSVREIDVSVRGTRSVFREVSRGIRLTATAGQASIEQSRGPVEIAAQNVDILVRDQAGPIQINGTGGQLRLERPTSEVRVDVRRAEVDLTVGSAIAMTILTTDEPLRVWLDERDGVAVDAAALDAEIQSADFSLAAEKTGSTARLRHDFGGRTAILVLRNERGDVVLRQRK